MEITHQTQSGKAIRVGHVFKGPSGRICTVTHLLENSEVGVTVAGSFKAFAFKTSNPLLEFIAEHHLAKVAA